MFSPVMSPFKYYVSIDVDGWGGQMLMFAHKVGGWVGVAKGKHEKFQYENLIFQISR